jgi:hypothetical protein
MAYRVQHPDEPAGVAVALLGLPGAGKGIVARTFGSFFGPHFAHITHGEQLTGRFNASLATSCAVFLDEAFWAGDRKSEGVLKALITEPTFQMEAKFRDPITVPNRLSIMVASNSDWAIPAGIGDRRWFVLNVRDTYAGMGHKAYYDALHAEVNNGGAAAMLHDLLAMSLLDFDLRVIPHTGAKAQQQVHSFRGTIGWLFDVLQQGSVGHAFWDHAGLSISTRSAYENYQQHVKQRREYQPEIKSEWSKKVRKALGSLIVERRPSVGGDRDRHFDFGPLDQCRERFAKTVGAPHLEWEEPDEADPGAPRDISPDDVGAPEDQEAGPFNPGVPPAEATPSAQTMVDHVLSRMHLN